MALLAVVSGKDTGVGQLQTKFSTGAMIKYAAARQAEKVVLCSGLSSSYAFFPVPISGWGPGFYDEAMTTIAMKSNGVLADIKLMSRMAVDYSEGSDGVNIFNGSIVSISHEFGDDSGLVEAWGDQHLLSKFTMFGCLVYDPQSKKFYYDMTRPCIYNNFGQADCMDSPIGPVHAPSFRCGHTDGVTSTDFSEPSDGTASKAARSWRVRDIGENLRIRHAARGNVMRPKVNIGVYQIPYFIDWPKGIFNVTGGSQPVKSINFQGWSLLQALQYLARYAGVYDIYTAPTANYGSVIQLLDMSGTGPKTTLYMPDYGTPDLGSLMASANVINDGYMCESYKNGFNGGVCFMGDGPALELMASELADDADVANALEPAWSADTDLAARTFIDTNGDDDAAFELAKEKYPLWLVGYRLKLDFNPWKTTKWSSMANGGRLRIKPFICTGFQQDATNPRDWQPREIIVEKYRDLTKEIKPPAVDTSGNYWERAFRYDNLTLNPDSTIVMLAAIRDRPQSDSNWFQNPNGVLDGFGALKFGLNILPRPLRINLAVEADWPITGFANGDPNNTSARVDNTYRYTWAVACPPMAYVELLRSDKAWPEGKAILPGVCTYPRKDQLGSELWSDLKTGLLLNHANTRLPDVNRIENNAMLRIAMLAPGMRPGLAVQVDGNNVLVNKGVLKSVTFSMKGTSRRDPKDKAPDTWIEIGAPDWAPRMDTAQNSPPSSGSSGAPTVTDTDHTPKKTQEPTDTDHSTPKTQQPSTSYSAPTKPQSSSETTSYNSTPPSSGGSTKDPSSAPVASNSTTPEKVNIDRMNGNQSPAAKAQQEQDAKSSNQKSGINQGGAYKQPSSIRTGDDIGKPREQPKPAGPDKSEQKKAQLDALRGKGPSDE
jgi:hypothetical protein